MIIKNSITNSVLNGSLPSKVEKGMLGRIHVVKGLLAPLGLLEVGAKYAPLRENLVLVSALVSCRGG